jgi:hypothetical protein
MWLFLGLLAALAAGSVADAVVASSADDEAGDGSGALSAREGQDADGAEMQGLNRAEWLHDRPGLEPPSALPETAAGALPADMAGSPVPSAGADDGDAWSVLDFAAEDLAAERLGESPADMPQHAFPAEAEGLGPGGQVDRPYPDMGMFDHLDERIHSSDLYPAAQMPQPSLQQAGAAGGVLQGSVADDTLIGGLGNDTLIGAGGNNVLYAGAGNNLLRGGEGDDWLIGGYGNDTLEGGWGDDVLIAGGGENLLMGGAGNDTLVGAHLDAGGQDQSGANFLNGGAGNDLLIAGGGDVLHGGEGADAFALGDWLAGSAPAMIMDYSFAEDRIVLHYDPARLATPEIAVTPSPSQPHMADIWLNGHVIAHVANAEGLRAEDIVLVADQPGAMALAAE